MPRLTWPRIKYPKSFLFMATLALLLLGRIAYVALHPRPVAARPPAFSPEWRCVNQTKGGPICYRPLPPAAKPPPR
jgi:hypothetical protein